MTKKPDKDKQVSVKVGNISDVSGEVNVAGGDIEIQHATAGLNVSEIRQLFDPIYKAIETRFNTPSANKADLKAEVQETQSHITEVVEKKKQVDEGLLTRRFRNIARMAPDILDVFVATLANPLAGLGVAVKKIADKAKSETG